MVSPRWEGTTIDWWTVKGGGATSSMGGPYRLGRSFGQADVGTMSGGTYVLTGGLESGADVIFYRQHRERT